MPTGIKNGDKATAMATKITARATSFVFMAISPYLCQSLLSKILVTPD
jgi:hypothetical protein